MFRLQNVKEKIFFEISSQNVISFIKGKKLLNLNFVKVGKKSALVDFICS